MQADRPESFTTLNRVQIAINLCLLFKVRNRGGNTVTIRSNVLLNGDGDTDLCPRWPCSCEPIGFLDEAKESDKERLAHATCLYVYNTYREADALRVVRMQMFPKTGARV